MPRGKRLTIERMKAGIQKTMGDLGCEVQFDPDEDLNDYKPGALLTMKELRAMPDGSIVWARYGEYDSPHLRVDGPYRTTKDESGWSLNDGSSFAASFEGASLKDGDKCVEDACGEGEMRLFRAVPR